MIKTLNEIGVIIRQGKPKWIEKAVKEYERNQVHVNGIGLVPYLQLIENYENQRQFEARKKLSISNRFLFANILRPVDKIFSAKGGSVSYQLPETSKETLLSKLADIRGGMSVKKWISEIQLNRMYVDPAGLIFFEWDKEKTYPTVKAISSIFNYECNGRSIEWVIFNPESRKDGEYYRVVDSSFDYMIRFANKSFTIIDDETFANPWGYVPAFTNSTLINPELTHKESILSDCIELADVYLRVNSIKQIYQNLHLYPIFWAYVESCRTCDGTGLYNGETCHTCNGEKHTFKKDVTDILKLKTPRSNDEPKLAPDIAGYIQPDLETLREMRTELKDLENLMTFTLWGTTTNEQADNETATGRWLDVQPVNDRLNKIADIIEDTEQKVTDIVGRFYFPAYKGSSVNYGRRFIVESSSAIWQQYETAREKNSPKDTLDYLLNQYYQSEFANDKETLSVYEKLIKIEPFIHKTDEQVQSLDITPEDKKAKFYYSEWKSTKEWDELVYMTYEQLQSDFKTYLSTKIIEDGKEVQGEGSKSVLGAREGME